MEGGPALRDGADSGTLSPGLEAAPVALTSFRSPSSTLRGLGGALPIQLTEKEQSKGSC